VTGAFVAVIEESLLGQLMPLLASTLTPSGTSLPVVPVAVIALPSANVSQPFSPASQTPLSQYYNATGSGVNKWNAGGLDLLRLTLPCSVFLAPEDVAAEVRSKAQLNVMRV
jgi:hypothetical protein